MLAVTLILTTRVIIVEPLEADQLASYSFTN